MRRKIIGIFICMLLIVTGVVQVSGTINESKEKKSLDTPISLYEDHVQTPLYTRSLQDIISGKPLPRLEGTRPLLVILADIMNIKKPNASHTVDYFDKMLFGPRPSLSDYYSEVSYGKFTYSRADILGWYKIYVTMRWVFNHPSEFLVKAVKAVDKDFDFAMYDTNHDGVVTNEELTLIVVFSSRVGYVANNWWADDEIKTKDGVFVQLDYSLLDEWEPITTFAHELGHDIGVPDLYDYDGDSNGTGDYCMMSNGDAGYPHFSAWCKIQLGWIIPTVVTTNDMYTLHDTETHPEALILCDLQHSALEYFLIENRYKGTSYDSIKGGKWYMPGLLGFFYPYYNYISDLPDEGIVIYHIDDNQSLRWWESGGLYANVNDMEEHKAVDVECADSPSSHFKERIPPVYSEQSER
jgi:M6 family metalloprotease-like protein